MKLQYEDAAGQTQTRQLRAKVVVDATGQSAILSNKLGLRRVNSALKKAAIWGHFRGGKRETDHGGVYTIVLWTNERKSWFWYIPQADDIVSIGVVGDNDYMLKRGAAPQEVFFQEVAKCPALQWRMEGAEQHVCSASRGDQERERTESKEKTTARHTGAIPCRARVVKGSRCGHGPPQQKALQVDSTSRMARTWRAATRSNPR